MKYLVAILMTLEGEYYRKSRTTQETALRVAILMTLEGEYYCIESISAVIALVSQSS